MKTLDVSVIFNDDIKPSQIVKAVVEREFKYEIVRLAQLMYAASFKILLNGITVGPHDEMPRFITEDMTITMFVDTRTK